MELSQIGRKVENSKITLFISRALSSYYFPAVTAVVVAVCYMCACEAVAFWYMGLCGLAILICCKDVTPVLSLLMFVQIAISIEHCPSELGSFSDYLFSPPVLAQEIILVVFCAVALIFRTVTGIVKKRFSFTAVFRGIALLSIVLIFNGLFYTHYSVYSLLFGLALGAVLTGVFVFACGNITIDTKYFKRIAIYMLAFFGALAVQLIFAYCTIDGIIVNGEVQRTLLFMGWGTYNNLGMMLTVCIPAWFYLASKTKFGWAFLLGAALNVAACFLSMSRQAMLTSTVISVICCIWILVIGKGKQRVINASVMGGVILITAIVCAVRHQQLLSFFKTAFISLETGSGRLMLWDTSINNFFRKPLFGVGFFDPRAAFKDVGSIGSDGNVIAFIPRLSHNTIFELMSACGLLGLVAYLYHRAQTISSLLNNFTNERLFICLILSAFLLCCLLDSYIFYFLPTAVYTFFIAILTVTEKQVKKRKTLAINGLQN